MREKKLNQMSKDHSPDHKRVLRTWLRQWVASMRQKKKRKRYLTKCIRIWNTIGH